MSQLPCSANPSKVKLAILSLPKAHRMQATTKEPSSNTLSREKMGVRPRYPGFGEESLPSLSKSCPSKQGCCDTPPLPAIDLELVLEGPQC